MVTSSADMGDLIPYRPRRGRDDGTGFVGMVIFLASWAMMFAALFFSYGIVRVHATVWPPVDQPPLPVAMAAVNTLVLLTSSLALQHALRSVRKGNVERVPRFLWLSAGLGAAFLALQTASWIHVAHAGMGVGSGPYASVFYALTCFHALHVLIGVAALVGLAIAALRGAYSAPRHQPVRLWTMYWHFVGVVWAVLFVTVYLV